MRKSRMQKIIISSVVALSSLAAMAQSNVSNIRVQTMDHVLIIQYDLATRADIEVFASFDGGANFTGPLQHVTGEAGRGIEPGRDKIIIWNVRNELGAMDNPNTVVKVVSTNEAGAPRVVASPPSSSDALISIGRKVYQWDDELDKRLNDIEWWVFNSRKLSQIYESGVQNDIEFKKLMALKLYKEMTPLSERDAQFLMVSTSEFAWAVYNKGVKKHKTGSWWLISGIPVTAVSVGLGSPVLIPGFALLSSGSTHIREAVAMHNNNINRNDVTQMMFNYNFEKGKKRNKIGNYLTFGGAGVVLLGGWILPSYVFQQKYRPYAGRRYSAEVEYRYNEVLGLTCILAGGAMMLTGIPLKITGKHLMRQPAALQSSGSNRAGLEMNVRITGNGAGLSLRF